MVICDSMARSRSVSSRRSLIGISVKRCGHVTPRARHASSSIWAVTALHLGHSASTYATAARESSKSDMARALLASLPFVLLLGRCPRLPLHVARIIGAAMLQRADVINDPIRTCTVGLARGRARVRPAEGFLRVRIAGDASVCVTLDAECRAPFVRGVGRRVM